MLLAINATFPDALSAINYYEHTVEITATEIRRYRHVNEQWLSPRRHTRLLPTYTLCRANNAREKEKKARDHAH